jgi:hypothetical protein
MCAKESEGSPWGADSGEGVAMTDTVPRVREARNEMSWTVMCSALGGG